MRGVSRLHILLAATGFAGAGLLQAQNPAQAAPQVKVAFITVEPLSGSYWTKAWDTARQQMVGALHIPVTVVGPVPENNQVATEADDLIAKGYNVIVGEDFAFQPFLHQVALAHPDVKFIVTGPNIEPPLPNVSTVYANLWQVRYLEGALAGLTTKTNTLGFVAAHAIPSVVAGVNGFELGALSVNPKAQTIVVQTGNWYAPEAAARAAETLAAKGADVIAQHQDDTGAMLGAEQAHVMAEGSEADTSAIAPKTYLSGSVYHWGLWLIPTVKSVMDGTWKAEDYSGDLRSGLVTLGPINANVPADIVAKVKAAEQGIIDGKVEIFTGPIEFNDGTTMVPAGTTLQGAGEIYPKQTGFVKGVIGNVKG
jgi:basic membrane protein A